MRHSEVNAAIRNAREFFDRMNFKLPVGRAGVRLQEIPVKRLENCAENCTSGMNKMCNLLVSETR